MKCEENDLISKNIVCFVYFFNGGGSGGGGDKNPAGAAGTGRGKKTLLPQGKKSGKALDFPQVYGMIKTGN
ncbi:hypothetical protein [uncultured Oscillibacter sp.]|uniref:hypothetical protein n=1 Tax=uncultured Oscillibacter sp. TaxID=876091 RepID=UPI00280C1A0D|nr:hypothetical protein [uncultured Oscillibacter sp.]